MCDETYSSVILAENKQLGVNLHEQSEFSWSTAAVDNLKQLFDLQPKIINIRGGEPLYNKSLLDILERLPEQTCRKIMLHVTTNATVWNDRWASVIKKFKLVRFMFSVDATKDLYEYLRFPGKWTQTETNVKHIASIDNVKPLVHCVVQNLNIGRLSDIIQWSLTQNIWLNLTQLVDPPYLGITVMPADIKPQVLEHLAHCLTIPQLPSHLEKFISSCQTQITESLSSQQDLVLWEQCLDYLAPRDQLRGNSHRKFFTY
jgi:molybdenum cofactor biosynthesis enzyme MoaA